MTLKPSRQHIPIIATALVLGALFALGAIRFGENFTSWYSISGFFKDNAFLGIAAIGLTFVILSGGIDLSVGAMVGFISIFVAALVVEHQMNPILALLIALLAGTITGALMGAAITLFSLPPFLVTLAAMFFFRGLGLVIAKTPDLSVGKIPFFKSLGVFSDDHFSIPAAIFLATVIVGFLIAHLTRFGRAVYAIGGNEQSAVLMGLPVRRTKIAIYALSGFCSALAGVVATLQFSKGDANAATGMELDAIAAVVIGGTLLSGGVGYILGTLIGVLILAVIQQLINFQSLDTYWTKIASGVLLLLFILLQKFIQSRGKSSH